MWNFTSISALRRPPLSCRTSPPQGGRLDATTVFANLRGRKEHARHHLRSQTGERCNEARRGGEVGI
ncbi:hypothetical protein FJ948_09385 [Mesorhizobium sp. B2-3-12]|nr:hypothetical protein FJ948_09385 [Mesorhizobium sp. B2-3-12]